jgi:hypothetical protein
MERNLMQTKIAALGLALLTIAPTAMAVHGSPYTAYGIAMLGTEVFDITVQWTGWWTRQYVVTITDQVTGGQLVYDPFAGYETWPWGRVYGNTEILLYHGYSAQNAAHFDIKGYQTINLQTGVQNMLYVGNYDSYTIMLIVDG